MISDGMGGGGVQPNLILYLRGSPVTNKTSDEEVGGVKKD